MQTRYINEMLDRVLRTYKMCLHLIDGDLSSDMLNTAMAVMQEDTQTLGDIVDMAIVEIEQNLAMCADNTKLIRYYDNHLKDRISEIDTEALLGIMSEDYKEGDTLSTDAIKRSLNAYNVAISRWLETFARYGKPALQPNLKMPLRTERAVKYFSRAEELGYIKPKGDGYVAYMSNAELSVFLKMVFGNNNTTEVQWRALGDLFRVGNLKQSYNQTLDAKKDYQDATILKEIFNDE